MQLAEKQVLQLGRCMVLDMICYVGQRINCMLFQQFQCNWHAKKKLKFQKYVFIGIQHSYLKSLWTNCENIQIGFEQCIEFGILTSCNMVTSLNNLLHIELCTMKWIVYAQWISWIFHDFQKIYIKFVNHVSPSSNFILQFLENKPLH